MRAMHGTVGSRRSPPSEEGVEAMAALEKRKAGQGDAPKGATEINATQVDYSRHVANSGADSP